MTLQVTTAATGVARTAHYVIPTGQTQAIPTLLLEPQRTNLCIRSEEFDTWTAGTSTITTNATTAPDGTVTADLIGATLTNSTRSRSVTFTGDGEKCFSIYLKANTSGRSQLGIFDSTASIGRHYINVTWTGGIPTIATAIGAGTLYPVEALANGWYRISFSATGIIALNNHVVAVVPDNLVGTNSIYAWGAQAEDAVVPSSYIKTEGVVMTRNADSLYFPFTAAPQAMTVYVRGVERGTGIGDGTIKAYVAVSLNNPRLNLIRTASGQVKMEHFNGVSNVTSDTAVTPALGDLVELRGVLAGTGAVTAGITRNNGAEVLGATSSALTLASAWNSARLNVGSHGSNVYTGLFAFTHIAIAQGEQSRDTMRQLAGVV